jgi:hypothetical protein
VIAAQDSNEFKTYSDLHENIRTVAFQWIASTTATPKELTASLVATPILNQSLSSLGILSSTT